MGIVLLPQLIAGLGFGLDLKPSPPSLLSFTQLGLGLGLGKTLVCSDPKGSNSILFFSSLILDLAVIYT